MKRIITGIVALSALVPATPAAARDYAQMARNIIPSGQYGSVADPRRSRPAGPDVRRPDAALRPRTPKRPLPLLQVRALRHRRAGAAAPEPVPRPGLRIVRDRFHVPHITGRTHGRRHLRHRLGHGRGPRAPARAGALQHPRRGSGRARTSRRSTLITEPAELHAQRADRARGRQADAASSAAKGRKGRRLLHDIDVFVAGHQRLLRGDGQDLRALDPQRRLLAERAQGPVPRRGRRRRRAQRASCCWSLQRRLGDARGESVWNDLRQRQDPETAVSVDGASPTRRLPKRRRRGNVILQNDTFEPHGRRRERQASPRRPPPSSSNILMVSGRRSTNGRPLFVGGPQIGYFYPGLTMEMDLHGPGSQSRGATAVPFPGYMLIGRGEDFGWTLTSAGADIIDTLRRDALRRQRPEVPLQGPLPRHGALRRRLAGRQSRDRLLPHGPRPGVRLRQDRRRARGWPSSRKRSSYGRDTLDQLFFQDLTRAACATCASSSGAASQTPQTFNAFYADNRDIGMFTTGRLPDPRPRASTPACPTDGRGRYEWRGVLSPRKRHVQGVNPQVRLPRQLEQQARRAACRPPTTSSPTARSTRRAAQAGLRKRRSDTASPP